MPGSEPSPCALQPTLPHPPFLPSDSHSLTHSRSVECSLYAGMELVVGKEMAINLSGHSSTGFSKYLCPRPRHPTSPPRSEMWLHESGAQQRRGGRVEGHIYLEGWGTRASLRAKGFHTGDRLCSQPHGHSGLKRWDGGHQSPWTEERQPCQGLGLPAMPPFPTTVPHLCSSRKCNCDSPLGAMASNPCNHNKPPSPSGCLHP